MPEISFYVLPTESKKERYQFACKLIEKAYRTCIFPYVLTDDAEQSRELEDLLWTFRAGSFVPHQVNQGDKPEFANTILIGAEQAPEGWRNTLINLSAQCPQNYEQAERILEILDNSEACKANGRQRYKQYQQEGFDIATHKL